MYRVQIYHKVNCVLRFSCLFSFAESLPLPHLSQPISPDRLSSMSSLCRGGSVWCLPIIYLLFNSLSNYTKNQLVESHSDATLLMILMTGDPVCWVLLEFVLLHNNLHHSELVKMKLYMNKNGWSCEWISSRIAFTNPSEFDMVCFSCQ